MNESVKPKPHVPSIRPAWLALRQEDILSPDLPVIDAHFHIWDFSSPPYFAAELAQDFHSGHHVVGGVFVECTMGYLTEGPEPSRCVGETLFVADQARLVPEATIAAIVAWADLSQGAAVQDVLQQHKQAAAGRLRGIRVRAAWDADPAAGYGATGVPQRMLYSEALRDGVRVLASQGLSLDVWAFHPQLDDIADLARACPGVQIIANHVGGPLGVGRYADQRQEVFAQWSSAIQRMAQHPNVAIKLGGLGISRLGFPFASAEIPLGSEALAEAWGPYVRTCIEAFGPQRCMFGSNFPVDKVMCSYPVLLNAFKRMTDSYSEAEKSAIFSRTAADIYRIPAASC
jgi:predicted TIM-barrel fold metal-dependent hydrolase